MARRKTHEEFVNELFDLVGNEYTVLEIYINSYTKINIKHNVCNEIIKLTPKSLLSGHGCPNCAKNKKKTTEIFKQEVFELVGNEFEVLGEYINSYTKLEMKHNLCGNIYLIKPNDFQQGIRCSECSYKTLGEKYRKTHDQFKKEVFDLVGDEYSVVGKYDNSYTKLEIRHSKCDYTFQMQPNMFLNGEGRCPYCEGNRKNTEIFKNEINILVGDEYEVIGEYVNNRTKIKMKHMKCNNEWDVKPNSFLNGSRCPKCHLSKGENLISKWLTFNSFVYEDQFGFHDCKYKDMLLFDFVVYNTNGEILTLIEYDGQQHFEPIEHFGGEENFKVIQIRDNIKNEYCKSNNIKLIRIPYWDFNNIDEILRNELL